VPRAALVLLGLLVVALAAGALKLGLDDDEGLDLSRIPPCVPSPEGVQRPPGTAPSDPAWRREEPSPLARDEARAAVIDGQIYMVGGHRRVGGLHPWRRWSSPALLIHDPRSGRFRRGPDLPRPVDHAGVVTHDGRLYVVGGFSNGKAQDTLWRYTPETERWDRLEPMRQARGALDAAVIGDRLYAVGGAPPTTPKFDAEPYDTVEVYDFESRRWSPAPDMPTARHHHSVAVLDGQLYAVGGRRVTEGGVNFGLEAVERFDPQEERWESLAPLPLGVSGLATVTVDGKLIAIGGSNEPEHWVTPSTWEFAPEAGEWRRLADLKEPRHAHAAAVVDGRILVLEGAPCAGYGQTHAVESLTVQ
jgi:Kelch motif